MPPTCLRLPPPHRFLLNRSTLRAAALAGALSVAALAGCSSLDEQQRRWIFQPAKETPWAGPDATAGMQDVWIDFRSPVAEGAPVRLHGVWLPQADEAQAPLLLYLHGARWDVRGSAPRIRRMHELGFSVLAIDYRGFGRSTDALPSEATADEDARAAWDWLAARQPQAPRFIFGHSLGGAIATRLAAEVGDQATGLMLENTFTSIRDVFASFKWGWLPVGPLITQRFDSSERAARLRLPTLVVHGSADALIPPALGQRLYERIPATRKKWVLVEGGTHHSTHSLAQAQYRAALDELFGLAAMGRAATTLAR
ncbi:alpha/beta hydrolase [Aquabacterium sp. J223]|uniref:alpha/beta hydrolase n=1 Tax=Aquabacterium sp. J223 TaxID=2898431 RepID=UPI0021AD6C54|nr:alpha/beta fold hydrolase [Aquabacterium sp. J223]UUX95144.1 alpha/beta fold hydrolase [Aquabacterium sp. J223]